MKEDNIILQKSYLFAVRIVRLGQYLVKEKHAYQLADQIRRSGTSIGANMEEAVGGLSRKDFNSQVWHIVQRGARNALLAAATSRH